MQALNIPPEIAMQAALLNRFGGTLQAWALLANHGFNEQQIFALLIGVDGPEHWTAAEEPGVPSAYSEIPLLRMP